MKLLLNTYSTNEYADGCEYAFLDLTKELAEEIQRRWEHFETVQWKDPSLTEMHFFGAEAMFVDGLPENLMGVLGDGPDFIEVEAAPDISENLMARTECDRMVITSQEVYWQAIPKHCDWHVETRPIPLETVRKALAQ
jgi:hypothetical protein